MSKANFINKRINADMFNFQIWLMSKREDSKLLEPSFQKAIQEVISYVGEMIDNWPKLK